MLMDQVTSVFRSVLCIVGGKKKPLKQAKKAAVEMDDV